MSAQMYRRQLESKRRQRADAEKKAGEYRQKEASKRSDATRARASAARSSSTSSASMKLREADRREDEANAASREAAKWQTKAAGYLREEVSLQERLAKAEVSERAAADAKQVRELKAAERRAEQSRRAADLAAAADRAEVTNRLQQTESRVEVALRELRAPRPEKLRILMLAASAEGDLRVGREQKRIRAAVESALHRDSIEFDMRPSATAGDLLDGITKFRPHVIHFSGHSSEDLVVFEDDVDEHHAGVVVSANTFAKAMAAPDEPPLLVMLNSCNSASQIDALVAEVAPFAVGMSDSIDDVDAITYATQFYAAIANGQSIEAAHLTAQVAVELAGLPGHDLPRLAHAADVDPRTTILVKPLG